MKKKVRMVDKKGNVVVREMEMAERKSDWFMDPTYLNLGFYLVTPLVAGVFLGVYLDSKFSTKPVFTLLFIALGLISTFYNLFNILKHAQQRAGDKH